MYGNWKRIAACLLVSAFGLILFAGCMWETKSRLTDEAVEQENIGSGVEDGSPKEVVLWYYWETESHQRALEQVIKDYNNSQDGIRVSTKYVPFADFKKQLSIGASADELPDLAIIDSPDHLSYAAMGIFAELTDKVDVSGYREDVVGSCMLDGALYGVPFGVNCLGLFYNREMLEKAGCKAPATWEELKETASSLTKGNITGFAFSALQGEEGTFNFLPWLWSASSGSEGMELQAWERALSFVQELVESGVMSRECMNWTQGDVMYQFISGNVAMMVNGSWQIPTIEREAPDFPWEAILIPCDKQYASVIGGENFAIIRGGNEEGALQFLEYVTAEPQLGRLLKAFGYFYPDQEKASIQYAQQEAMGGFLEALEYARVRGPLVSWPDVSDEVSSAFNQVITGEKEPKEAAKEARQAIEGILRGEGEP